LTLGGVLQSSREIFGGVPAGTPPFFVSRCSSSGKKQLPYFSTPSTVLRRGAANPYEPFESIRRVENLCGPPENYPGRRNLRRLSQFYGGPSKNCAGRFGSIQSVENLCELAKNWASRRNLRRPAEFYGEAPKNRARRFGFIRGVENLCEPSKNDPGRRILRRPA
jgi:hypothetical protein